MEPLDPRNASPISPAEPVEPFEAETPSTRTQLVSPLATDASTPIAFETRPTWHFVALAALLHLALRVGLAGVAVELDEPLWLRWLRKVDEHPVRCAVATALVAWSLAQLPRCLASAHAEIGVPRA